MNITLKPEFPKLTFTILIILFLLQSFLVPGNVITQHKEPEFVVDYAQFKLPHKEILLEIYYSLNRESLTYRQDSAGYRANGLIQTYLITPNFDVEETFTRNPDSLQTWLKQQKKICLVDSFLITDFINSFSELSLVPKIVEIGMVKLKKGNYDLLSIFTDINSTNTEIFRDFISVRNFSNKKFLLSDVQLANSISTAKGAETKFDKNGLRVVPNADKGYFIGNPNVHFYTEVYNLRIKGKAGDSPYRIDYTIIDQAGNVVLKTKERVGKKNLANAIINGTLDCFGFSNGFYKFKIKITDEFTGNKVESEKNFYIFN